MAIYHFSVQMISRGKGRSSVASAAYRSAQRLRDDRLGKTHDYAGKTGVVHAEVIVPANVPSWASERARLWNEAEAAERRRDAQVAREVRVALPVELSLDEQVATLRSFVREQFVSRGMVVDFALHHDNAANPHAHIGLTTRSLSPEGFGPKRRDWNDRALLGVWREAWAHACNRTLVRGGHEGRVDHRSHADRGLELEPTGKVGLPTRSAEDRRSDIVRERRENNESVRRRNGEAIVRDPKVALAALTYHEATFTERRLERWLERETASPVQKGACLEAVMASSEVRRVGRSRYGEDVYSTREMLETEWALLRTAKRLAEAASMSPSRPPPEAARRARGLSEEQQEALRFVTEVGGRLSVVEGWAGTGKSRLFAAARERWEGEGLRVLGGALSGQAAAGLREAAGLGDSRTLAAWEYAWSQGRERLGRRDVLVMDEASLVGTRQMARVLAEVSRAGAKAVLVGDTRQLQAIEAGSPMRMLGQVSGRVFLREIRRQAVPWQRRASAALAAGEVREALAAYQECTHLHSTSGEAPAAIARAWVEHERGALEGGLGQVALSHRRRDVATLNAAIRSARQEAGLLASNGPQLEVETSRGRRWMAAGDRVCFLRNDRQLGVHNGSTGAVEGVSSGCLRVRLDQGRSVVVPLGRYRHLDHGYALTIHKAQGVTVDHAHVWATPGMDRHAGYVAMTRHRRGLSLHAERPAFTGRWDLASCLSRSRPKGLASTFVEAQREHRRRHRSMESARDEAAVAVGRRRQELLRALASARSSVTRLCQLTERPIPTLANAVLGTQACREGQRRLQSAEQSLAGWEQLARQLALRHPVRARLGAVGQLHVTPPGGGAKVRLLYGLSSARSHHAAAQASLTAARLSPSTVAEGQRVVESARERRVQASASLVEAEVQVGRADEALRSLDRQHPEVVRERDLARAGKEASNHFSGSKSREACLEAQRIRLLRSQAVAGERARMRVSSHAEEVAALVRIRLAREGVDPPRQGFGAGTFDQTQMWRSRARRIERAVGTQRMASRVVFRQHREAAKSMRRWAGFCCRLALISRALQRARELVRRDTRGLER